MRCAKEDGIYFDVPEDEYHALPRLSASGIQNMMVSPATFWARSWMNPENAPENRADEKEAAFRTIGRAYHCARLEPEQFEARYCRDLVKEDLPEGSLLTDTDIKAALKEIGEPQTKGAEGVLDRARRLLDANPDCPPIWHIAREAFEEDLKGRTPLPPKVWAEIREDADRLRRIPEIAELLSDGAPEVTILWTDEESGAQMKARIDWLSVKHFADLKTYDNSRGKTLAQVFPDAFRYNRYYIQAALYWQAVERIRTTLLQIQGDATEAQRDLIARIRRNEGPMRCWYVMQEKGGVPNIIALEVKLLRLHFSTEIQAEDEAAADRARAKYADKTRLYSKAEVEIRHCIRTYCKMREIYQDGEPWLPLNPLRVLDDEDFSDFWLDSDQ